MQMSSAEFEGVGLPIPDAINEAQRIHTEAYLRRGLIDADSLNEDHLYTDEYTPRSEAVVVADGEKKAAIRLIHTDKKQGGLMSLPTLKHFSVDPQILRDTAHATRLSTIDPSRVVEVSGLGSVASDEHSSYRLMDSTVRSTFAAGLRRSLDEGHNLWVMNVDPFLKRYLDRVLDHDLVKQVGEERRYQGDPTIPVALSPQDTVESILGDEDRRFSERNKQDIHAAMQGVSEKNLSRKLIGLMHDNDIQTEKASLAARAWQSKRFLLYGSMVGYSALRFIPLSFVKEFDGSLAAFAAIDVGTAATQAASMELYFKGNNRLKRALGATAAIASFVAPYAYVGATNGEGSALDYPWYVYAVAGGFAAISGGLELSGTLKDNRLARDLQVSDIEATNN